MTNTDGLLAGRSALITGSSRGIGYEIARWYLQAGADVFLCARDEVRLRQAADELKQVRPGARIGFAAADVGSESDVGHVVGKALEQFPDLDILVNNAGIWGPMGPLETIDWRSWADAVATNLYGSVLTVRALLPHLKARKYGKIIQLSGGGATKPMARFTAYCASKAAVVRFIETVAEECLAFGIDANSVSPGAVNTGMVDEVISAGPEVVGAEQFEQARRQKEKGGASPSEGAALALFLASHQSDGITGRLISALWDLYQEWPARRDELARSDAYTLRRITGRDRDMAWGDR